MFEIYAKIVCMLYLNMLRFNLPLVSHGASCLVLIHGDPSYLINFTELIDEQVLNSKFTLMSVM